MGVQSYKVSGLGIPRRKRLTIRYVGCLAREWAGDLVVWMRTQRYLKASDRVGIPQDQTTHLLLSEEVHSVMWSLVQVKSLRR